MAIQHVNRKGDTYYLHQGKTKTGKAKWFFSTKAEGELVDTIPEGYEIYENPNAQVFLRKKTPKLITDEEVAVVEAGVRQFARLRDSRVEVKAKNIVIYLRNGMYLPMMRFTLVDEEKRHFTVERWCFRGSIDDWFPLGGYGDLTKLVSKYAPHLGKESFYELM